MQESNTDPGRHAYLVSHDVLLQLDDELDPKLLLDGNEELREDDQELLEEL